MNKKLEGLTGANSVQPQQTKVAPAKSVWRSFACTYFPIVIDPFGIGYYRWQIIVSVTVLYNIFCIPTRMAFEQMRQPYLDAMWLTLDYICDLIYLLDIVVHLYIGIPRKGTRSADLQAARKEYYRSIIFKMDVISILPTDLFYILWGIRLAAVRLNRLLRVHRLHHLFARTHIHYNQSFMFGSIQILLYTIVFIHFNACLYYALNDWLGFGSDSWTFPDFTNSTLPQEGHFINLYMRSFHWALIVLAQDVDKLRVSNTYECVLRIFVTLEGMLLMGAGIAIAEHLLAAKNRLKEAYQRSLDAVKQYMRLRQVDKEMQKRVLGWFNYVWEQKRFSDEQRDLESLPPILKLAIAKAAQMDTFQRVKMFRGIEPQALEELIMRLELQFYCPGDLVFKKGDIAREMYIVRSGLLQVVSDDGNDFLVSLSQGSVFGEVSLLTGLSGKSDQKRTNTVRSQSYSEIFILSNFDFQEVLENFPLAREAVYSKSRPPRSESQALQEAKKIANKKTPFERKLEKLLEKTPALTENIMVTFSRMIAETNELKKHLTLLERLDKLEDEKLLRKSTRRTLRRNTLHVEL